MHHLTRLITHLAWADAKVLDALKRATTLDPSILELYAHILGAENVWLARLEARAPVLAVWPPLSLQECETHAERNRRELAAYLASLDAPGLARDVTYRNSAGQEFTNSVEDILIHLALHGVYHRGQISTLLRRGGQVPEPTDYIAFIRGAPAATRRD